MFIYMQINILSHFPVKNSIRMSQHIFIFSKKNLSHSYTPFRKHRSIIQNSVDLVSLTSYNFTFRASLLNYEKLLHCQMPSYLGSILRNTSLNHKTRIQHLRTHLIFWTSSFFSRKTPTPAWHSSPYNLVAGIVYSYFGRHYEIHKWVIFTVASTFSDIKSQQKKK